MRQRAMIAMALVCDPDLLIADEPTTALDVTVQAQILDLLKDLQQEFGTAIIFITHDLGVIADIADDVLVMYAGRARGARHRRARCSATPQHPYTWGLLGSMPQPRRRPVDVPLTPIPGTPPSLLNPPSGCRFHPRCAFTEKVGGARCVDGAARCSSPAGRGAACHLTAGQRTRVLRRSSSDAPAPLTYERRDFTIMSSTDAPPGASPG